MTSPAYRSGSTVDLTVAMPANADGPMTASAITRTVTDEAGAVISASTAVTPPTPGDATVTVQVDAAFNTLATGTVVGIRQVETVFTTAAGSFFDVQRYVVKSSDPLVRMVNSFITLPETLLTRYEMTSLDGWDLATEDEQIAALLTAYKNMVQLRFRYPLGEKSQSRVVDFYGMSVDNVFGRIYFVLADIAFYSATDFSQWPTAFQNALKRAQMAEADTLLKGDPVAVKRDAGILMERTGESAMSFRNVPDIVLAVSREALRELRGFLQNHVLIARG